MNWISKQLILIIIIKRVPMLTNPEIRRRRRQADRRQPGKADDTLHCRIGSHHRQTVSACTQRHSAFCWRGALAREDRERRVWCWGRAWPSHPWGPWWRSARNGKGGWVLSASTTSLQLVFNLFHFLRLHC